MWPPKATWSVQAAGDLGEIWTPVRRKRNAVRRRLAHFTIPRLDRLVSISHHRPPFALSNRRPVDDLDHCTALLSPHERILGNLIIGTINRGLAAQAIAEATTGIGEATTARVEANVAAEEALYLLRVLEREAQEQLQRHP
jgi:hypothetical protein